MNLCIEKNIEELIFAYTILYYFGHLFAQSTRMC